METIGDGGQAVNLNQTTDPTGYTPTAALDSEPPGGYCQPEVRYRAFRAALAGVDLGSFDIRIIHWLVGWDDPTVRTVVSLLWRARQAGEAAGMCRGGGGACRRRTGLCAVPLMTPGAAVS